MDKLTVTQLKPFQPLNVLTDERLAELISVSSLLPVARDNRIQTGRELLYLFAGEVLLHYADGSSRVIVGGSDDSLWPLSRTLPDSIKAITDVTLLQVDDDLVDVMLTWDQLALAAGQQEQEAGVDLRSLKLGALACLPADHVETLLSRFETIPFRRGDVVIREGDAGDYYYVVESGRLEVSRQVGEIRMLLAELKMGDAFGEEALLAGTQRNATVTMKTDGLLLRLSKADFMELLREPFLRSVNRAEAERLVAEEKAVWLDVRFSTDYRFDRMPGAINMPLGELRNAFDVLNRDRTYVVYCRTGRRSAAAAFLLAQRGFHAFWLTGGLRVGMPTGLLGGAT